jgi:uncharacterized protein (TIGR02246 family)
MSRFRMPAALLAIAVAGCATTASTVTSTSAGDVRAEVERITEQFEMAANAGRISDLVAFYAPDAIVLPANSPPVVGPAAIGEFWTAAAGMKMRNVELTLEAVEVHGDVAIETGTYAMTLTPPGGADINDRGKYLVVWKRQADGSWKLYRDMFSTNLPAH